MKIINLSDIHLKPSAPVCRTDNYRETGFNKLEYVLKYAQKNGITFILQSGDFFDHPRMSLGYVGEVISLINKYDVCILAAPGQHDLFYHQTALENTPLGLLKAAGCVEILGVKPIQFNLNDKFVHVYGAGWNEEIPKIVNKYNLNILATHRMVIKDKLWFDQEDYVTAGSLLKNNDFDLICSGDNHQTFTELHKGKRLVNVGSMLRSSVAQKDHKPCFFVYDTTDKSLKQEFIPVEPFEQIALIDEHEEKKELQDKTKEYREALNKKLEDSGLDFKANLNSVIKEAEANSSIKQIIGEAYDGKSEQVN